MTVNTYYLSLILLENVVSVHIFSISLLGNGKLLYTSFPDLFYLCQKLISLPVCDN